MRTTLDIDQTLLNAAKQMASQSNLSVGAIISHLAVKGLESSRASIESTRNGFPVFSKSDSGQLKTEELVKDLMNDEDLHL